jgi:hypothetical protein
MLVAAIGAGPVRDGERCQRLGIGRPPKDPVSGRASAQRQRRCHRRECKSVPIDTGASGSRTCMINRAPSLNGSPRWSASIRPAMTVPGLGSSKSAALMPDTSHMALPVPHYAVVGVPLRGVEIGAVWLASRILEHLYGDAAGRRGVQVAAHQLSRLAGAASVKDVVAARYQLALVPLYERIAASREGRCHAVISEAPYPLLGSVEGVSAVEHRREIASEPLCHAALLCQRRRVERIGHEARKLDGVEAVNRKLRKLLASILDCEGE